MRGFQARKLHELGLSELRSTHDVCTELYEWATVTPLRSATALAEASLG